MPNSQWTSLAESASSGELYLDPDVASRCAQHCADLVIQLRRIQSDTQQLSSVNGMGTLPSGIALATKFSQKAAGGDVYSMTQALVDHIATVTEMRDVFTRIHAMYTTTEQDKHRPVQRRRRRQLSAPSLTRGAGTGAARGASTTVHSRRADSKRDCMNTRLPIRSLLAAALLSSVVLGAAGCGGDTTDTAQTAGADSVAELSAAASPAERLEAAVGRTLSAGPMRVTAVANGMTIETQADYSKRISYVTNGVSGESSPAQSIFMRGDVILARFAQDTAGAKADTWYRFPEDEEVNRLLSTTFDVDWVKQLILSASEIVTDGTDEVNGAQATHFVVTPDRDALLDHMLTALPDSDQPKDAAERETAKKLMPAALHYWVDDDGYLVREDDGFQVKTYHDFGVPLDLPEIDESTVPMAPDN